MQKWPTMKIKQAESRNHAPLEGIIQEENDSFKGTPQASFWNIVSNTQKTYNYSQNQHVKKKTSRSETKSEGNLPIIIDLSACFREKINSFRLNLMVSSCISLNTNAYIQNMLWNGGSKCKSSVIAGSYNPILVSSF